MSRLSPFVYWAQTDDKITLRIDLRDAKEPQLDIDKQKISFIGIGTGAKGFAEYAFELKLFDEVKPKISRFNITGRQIDLVVDKELAGSWWPRLTEADQKLAWLKIDFDKWRSEDGEGTSSEDDEEMNGFRDKSWQDRAQREQLKQLRKELASARQDKDKLSAEVIRHGLPWKQTYLMVYGLFQFLAYLRISVVIMTKLSMHKQDAFTHMFDSIGTQIIICQCAALLEIIHPLMGLVNTNVKPAIMQAFGRNLVLFLLILPEPRLQEKPVTTVLILVWSLSEVCRYPYYLLALIKKEYNFITWLRYSMWVPLYPLGFICEGVLMLRSLPYLEETERYHVRLPQPLNDYVIQFHYLLILYMIVFLPGGIMLMNYMYKQRKHKLLTKQRKLKAS